MGVAAVMCASYVLVAPSPERCSIPDSAFIQADRIIRAAGACGAGVAVLAAAVRPLRAGRRTAAPGTLGEPK